MSVPDSYFNSAGKIDAIFRAIQSAGVPDRFTHEFLRQLGFTSTTDRAAIPVLKALRFLDDNSVPTERYKRFRDTGISGFVMAEALRDAYADIFTVNENAQDLPSSQAAEAFKRVTGKGDAVAKKMATTFKTLAHLADWSAPSAAQTVQSEANNFSSDEGNSEAAPARAEAPSFSLRHDIHVHLPSTPDVKVYDAIFRSLRDHF